MSSFDSNGNYNKTNWKTGDKITADKLNKIEESLEIINNNDIERHKEADGRLDKLEQNEKVIEEELNNKATKEHTHDEYLTEHQDISNLATKDELNQGKTDMEAMVETVEGELEQIIYLANKIPNDGDYEKLKYAICNKKHVLIDRVYNIDNPILIENINDIYIDFNKNGMIKHGVKTLFIFQNCSNVTINNAIIEGVYTNIENDSKEFAIIFRNTNDDYCENIKITNSRFYNETHVLNFVRCKNVKVYKNVFDNIYGFGESDIFCENIDITYNTYFGRGNTSNEAIDDDVGGALSMSSRSKDILFSFNKVYDSIGNGAKAEGCENVIYTNNVIDRYGKDGLKVMHCTHYDEQYVATHNFTITNNVITNGKKWRIGDSGAITLNCGVNGVVSNNIITGDGLSEKTGILATTWVKDEAPVGAPNARIDITDNVITKCSQSIVFARSTEGHIDISITGNKMDSISRFLDCASTLVVTKNKTVLSFESDYNYCIEILRAEVVIFEGNTLVNGNANNLYCISDRPRIINNEFRFDEPTQNRNSIYLRSSSELRIENNRITNAYRSITISADGLLLGNINGNIIVNNGDCPITISNHSESGDIYSILKLSISNNSIYGYYTKYSNGLGVIWFIMNNYSIDNLTLDGNTIVKSNTCHREIFPANVIYADYKGNEIKTLVLGKSTINHALITLDDLTVGKRL